MRVPKTKLVVPGELERAVELAARQISHATKANDEKFSVWLLNSGYPSRTLDLARRMTARYIFQEGDREPLCRCSACDD